MVVGTSRTGRVSNIATWRDLWSLADTYGLMPDTCSLPGEIGTRRKECTRMFHQPTEGKARAFAAGVIAAVVAAVAVVVPVAVRGT